MHLDRPVVDAKGQANPSEDVILTFSGRLRVANVGDTLQLDMPTLEAMGLVEYTVNDPYSGVDVVYTGVLMSQISRYVGASQPWDTFRIVALDDYQVEINFPDVERWPILLATRSDGEYMTVENSGPTRIIYPYDSFPELDPVEYNDLWIWNIASIQVN